jgi:nicotinate-nucleotide pyrophosphorylase
MKEFDPLIRTALKEDVGGGDVTTEVFIPKNARFEGRMFSKTAGVLAGVEAAAACSNWPIRAPGSACCSGTGRL